ncbi:hypothetical protein GA0070619_5075 [Micromonospora zamorensis]|nr:hypothetical protein [Micromonospora zamorensis]SCG64970.1 hypothetical protein GA0070619_5075 [Micromonospora zamorensis]
MSETGQPGAATPGEHGDGAGQHDDPTRSVSGWAPPAGGWPRAADHEDAREQAPRWQPDPASGWRTSSTRHGDLPSPLAGLPGDLDPPTRVNGHNANGVHHPDDANGVRRPGLEPTVGRPTPVSAPPGLPVEGRPEPASDRLVVPAQRPAPRVEQGVDEPDRSAADPAAAHRARWAEPGLPTSAPPAVQVPPVGTAASGFEVPPGFHAPNAERLAAEDPPAAGSRDRRDPLAPEHQAAPGRTSGPAGPADATEPARAAEGPRPGDAHRAGESSAIEPDWSGPSWNRPSWGGGWAPPWSRPDDEPAGPPTTDESAPGWVAEPIQPYEPVRAGSPRPYEPVRAEPPRGYDPVRSDVASEAAPERPAEPTSGPPAGRPTWAAPPAVPPTDRPLRAVDPDQPPTGEPGVPSSGTPPLVPPGTPPPAVERPAWAGGPTPTSGPPANRPSWAGSGASRTPRIDRPSWAGGAADPEPTSGPPARPSWAGGSDAASTGTPSVRPSWAGGAAESEPTSAPPARPSWAASPASADAPPPAPAGPPPALAEAPPAPAGPPLVAERPTWAGGPPTSPVSTAPEERPDWSEGRIPATPVDRPSWGAIQSSMPRGGDDGEAPGMPRPEIRPATAPFRLRPATPDLPGPSPVDSHRPAAPTNAPSPGDLTSSSTGSTPPPATNGSEPHDRPGPVSASPYAARRSAPDPTSSSEPADDARQSDPKAVVLPQRVPAEPDVPVVPEPPAVEPPAETPELARIATHLRRDDEPAPLRERPEGFDVNAILDAVREVAGVRDAALRRTPAGAHSLRLDLADGADPAEVSRQVARLLQDRMGLAAAPQNVPGLPSTPPPPVRRRVAEPRAAERRTPEQSVTVRDAAAEARTGEVRAVETPTSGRPSGARVEAMPAGIEQRPATDISRRRRSNAPHRGRATVEEPGSVSAAPAGGATGSPATLGTSYSGGQVTTTESAPSRPLDTGGTPGPRVVIDHVQVSTFGLDANVEVRLLAGGDSASGYATGPAVDGYVLRLCAVAAAAAVDELLRGAENAERGRCFVEHAAVVPFGNCEVATVVALLVCEGWVEQLAGSALVAGDPRQAVVRATLAAVNRRLEALLS